MASVYHAPPRSGNVLHFRPLSHKKRVGQAPNPADIWKRLTAVRVMEKARDGTLDPAVVAYLLAGIGLDVGDAP